MSEPVIYIRNRKFDTVSVRSNFISLVNTKSDIFIRTNTAFGVHSVSKQFDLTLKNSYILYFVLRYQINITIIGTHIQPPMTKGKRKQGTFALMQTCGNNARLNNAENKRISPIKIYIYRNCRIYTSQLAMAQ